jgi:hypothetical protein
LVTVLCVWFHFVGVHAVTLWQLTQFVAAVGMCVPLFPAAALPLWQLEQLVDALNRLWSGLEPAQVLVDLWQLSHTV